MAGDVRVYDEFQGDTGVFDFEELANHLLEQGQQSSPSALHGCLCGLLAAGAPREGEFCLEALAQALELVLHGDLAGQEEIDDFGIAGATSAASVDSPPKAASTARAGTV